jgi:uncharacterized repeat protein (TIGR01451 family)
MRTLGSIRGAAVWLAFGPAMAAAQGNPDLLVNLTKAGLGDVPTRNNVAFVATISNASSVQAANVLTRVTMPTGFTNLATTPAPGSGITCTVAGSVVSCTAPTMPGNSEKTFRISSTAPATIAGQSQSFSLAGVIDPNNAIPEGGPGNSNNSDNLTVNVVTRADLTVSLTGPPGSVLTTQVAPDLVYLVSARNAGDRAASNVLVRATLPKDVAFVRVQDNTLGTCLQNSTASNGALNINCTLSSLAAGATGRVRILGRVLGSVPDKVQVTFAANVDPSNSVPERNDTDNTAFMVTTLRARADLVASGRVTTSNIRRLGPPLGACSFCRATSADVRLSVVVTNTGPYASPATTLATQWPSAQINESQGPGSCNTSHRCSVAVPALASGASTTILGGARWRHDSHDPASGGIIITADPNQTVFDPIIGNNATQVTVTVQ